MAKIKSPLKVFEYSKCSTCKKALKFLDQKNISYEKLDITVEPPSLADLKKMLVKQGDIKKLFNTSGLVYKEMKLSEKLAKLSEAQALQLLASNGRLVKRPFVIGNNLALVGFREEEWSRIIAQLS